MRHEYGDTETTTTSPSDARAIGGGPAAAPPAPPSTGAVTAPPDAGRVGTAGRLLRRAGIAVSAVVARYCRLEIEIPAAGLPPAPALIVANHGFGGLYDLNVAAIAETLQRLGIDETTPATFLAHKTLWTFGVGPLLEPAGFAQADPAAAQAAFDRGAYVVVLPGGDLDAAKPFPQRNEIRFGGRSGFARIAMANDVPIVPIVVVGAGESALVVSDGARLAKITGIARHLRAKTMPVSLTLPWGLSAGIAGVMVPYLPLPTKLDVAVLDPMRAEPDEDAAAFAQRVSDVMNAASNRLAEGRIPVFGRPKHRRTTQH